MLPEKPWTTEAILRRVLCLFVCQCLAVTALAGIQLVNGGTARSPWIFAVAVTGSAIFAGVSLFVLHKPWEWDRLERSFLVSIFIILAAFFFSALAQSTAGKSADISTMRAVIGALSFHGAALVLLPRFLREHRTNFGEAFGFSVNWKWALTCGALGAFIFFPVGAFLQFVSAHTMDQLGWKPEAQSAVQVLGHTETWRGRLALGAVTILLAPVVEEILFRGILYPWVKRLGYPRLALWGVSVFFAAIHANLPIFLPLLVLAILLTKLYENTQNLLAPIAVHCLFNAANFILFFLGDTLNEWLHRWLPSLR